MVVRDIRPVVADRERLQMLTGLARLRTELAAALIEHDRTLPVILDRAAAALASTIGDACVIALVDRERGLLVPTAFHHRDPLGEQALAATLTLQPTPLGTGLAGRVAVDGIPIRVADLPRDEVRDAVSPQYRSYVDQFPTGSIVMVPLRGREGILGVLGLSRGPAYSDDDEQMVADVAHLVALAIEDARHDARLQRTMFVLRTATNALPARVSYWNADERNEFANDAYRDWLGVSPGEIHGRHVKDVIGDELYESTLPYIRRVLAGERQDFDITLTDASGRSRHYQVTYVPDRRSDGRVVGFVVLATDVTELTLTAAEFEYQALHDPLTGLANRRALLDHIELSLRQLPRVAGSLALFYVDLDDFKHINDRDGHAVGDQVLVATAERIRSVVREGDTAARVGGDEFVILCHVRDRAEADDIGVRLHKALDEPIVVAGRDEVTVSASLGLAVVEASGSMSAEELLTSADRAMFSEKRRKPPSTGSSSSVTTSG